MCAFFLTFSIGESYSDENARKSQEVTMKLLDNGLKLIIKKNAGNDIFAAVCMIDIGSLYEESEKVGITNFLQNVVIKGTKKRSAEEIANEIEAVGGSIDTSASADYAQAEVMTLSEDYDLALEMLSDVLFNPSFPDDEIEKERKLILTNMKLAEDNTFHYTYKNFLSTLYSGHHYEFLAEGTPESVGAITKDDLIEHHKKYFIPSNMVISIVSNLDEDTVLKTVKKYFGMPSPLKPPKVTTSKDFENGVKTKSLSKKTQQSYLTIGYITAPVSSEDYAALKVANTVLGEGMASRLFVELRDKKGLAYEVGSIAPSRREKSHLMGYIGTKPETLKESEQEMLRVFNSLVEKEVPADELERCKNFIVGRYQMDHERNLRQAYYLAWFEIMGRGFAFDEKYPEEIKKVTARDILKVANKYFINPTIVSLKSEEAQNKPAPENENTK